MEDNEDDDESNKMRIMTIVKRTVKMKREIVGKGAATGGRPEESQEAAINNLLLKFLMLGSQLNPASTVASWRRPCTMKIFDV